MANEVRRTGWYLFGLSDLLILTGVGLLSYGIWAQWPYPVTLCGIGAGLAALGVVIGWRGE